MERENVLISIIIPVYNVEKYVRRCLDSITLQTYTNLEIIIVNDGSTDNSKNICEEYVSKDNRIKMINQNNFGLSSARNVGIELANGKYIAFVDSDDFVDLNYIKSMYDEASINNTDIVCCDFNYIDEDDKKWTRIDRDNKYYFNMEAIDDIIIGKQYTEVMTWNKLYKLDLFITNNIRFPVGKLNEDNFTTYKLYYYSNKISLINDKLYYYFQRKNSIMNSKFNIKRLDILEVTFEMREFFKDKNIDLNDKIDSYDFAIKSNLLNKMIRDNFNGSEKIKLIDSIYKNKKKYINNQYISGKFKLSIILIGKKAKFYAFILKLKDNVNNKIRRK